MTKLANTPSQMEKIAIGISLDLVDTQRHLNSNAEQDIENMLDAIFNRKIDKTKNIPGQLVAAAQSNTQTVTSKTSGCCVIL